MGRRGALKIKRGGLQVDLDLWGVELADGGSVHPAAENVIMAYIVTACIVMAYTVMACIVTAYIVKAYTDMALYSYGPI